MLYFLHDSYKRSFKPLVYWLNHTLDNLETFEKYNSPSLFTNYLQAKYSLWHDFLKEYPKPSFGFDKIEKNGKTYEVRQEVIEEKPFCQLRLFKTYPEQKKPALFIVAPLSGHYATLLKDTVKAACADFDVYITDWINCRDVPTEVGEFGFDDYVDYVIDFGNYIKETYGHLHILAVCQPTVPVLSAAAFLAKQESQLQPDSIVLMGGPVDTRISPTEVNNYALKHDINWFKNNVIYPVPPYYKGAGRMVYPGFLQYYGFLSMNMKRHTQAHVDFFNHLLAGADMDAKKHQDFYNEYNAVMDLPARYYLETLERVFIDQKLAKGTMHIHGVNVGLQDLKHQRLLMIEGELDDISGTGQTHAAYDLCSSLPANNKKKLTIEKVGHYGIFAGKTWRNIIYPQVKDFILNKKEKVKKN